VEAEVTGICVKTHNNSWIFKLNLTKIERGYYTPKEPELRVKDMIGQSKERFDFYEVIGYTISDTSCNLYVCEQLFEKGYHNITNPSYYRKKGWNTLYFGG